MLLVSQVMIEVGRTRTTRPVKRTSHLQPSLLRNTYPRVVNSRDHLQAVPPEMDPSMTSFPLRMFPPILPPLRTLPPKVPVLVKEVPQGQARGHTSQGRQAGTIFSQIIIKVTSIMEVLGKRRITTGVIITIHHMTGVLRRFFKPLDHPEAIQTLIQHLGNLDQVKVTLGMVMQGATQKDITPMQILVDTQ